MVKLIGLLLYLAAYVVAPYAVLRLCRPGR